MQVKSIAEWDSAIFSTFIRLSLVVKIFVLPFLSGHCIYFYCTDKAMYMYYPYRQSLAFNTISATQTWPFFVKYIFY